jgi:hypothetical protein
LLAHIDLSELPEAAAQEPDLPADASLERFWALDDASTGLCTADGGFADVVVGRSRAGGAREKGRENPRCATCADQRRAFHHRRVDVRDNRVEVRVLFGASRKPCKAGSDAR